MHVDREDVFFISAGDSCAAWLYPATADAGAVPIVVMAHGLSGTRRDRLGPFAERFAAAGFAALVFDHRGFGDSGGEPDLFNPAVSSRIGGRRSPSRARCPAIDASRVVDLRLLDGRRQRARGCRGRPGRRSGDQPGPLPRHRAAGAPRLAARHRPDARGGCPRRAPAGDRPAERAGLHQRSGRGGGVEACRRDRRGLALAQPRLLALAARPAIPPGPSRAQAALPLAGLRRRGRPRRQARPGDLRRPPRSARRAAHLPGRRPLRHLRRPRSTRPSSPTSSTSCAATCG